MLPTKIVKNSKRVLAEPNTKVDEKPKGKKAAEPLKVTKKSPVKEAPKEVPEEKPEKIPTSPKKTKKPKLKETVPEPVIEVPKKVSQKKKEAKDVINTKVEEKKKPQEDEEKESEVKDDGCSKDKIKKKRNYAEMLQALPTKRMRGRRTFTIALSGGIDEAERETIAEAVQYLGNYKIVEDGAFTHLIVNEDMEKRTLKIILGLSGDTWILSRKWIYESLSKESWQAEEKYEIGLYPKRSARKDNVGIFNKMSFFIHCQNGDFNSLDLVSLIERQNGKIVRVFEKCTICIVDTIPKDKKLRNVRQKIPDVIDSDYSQSEEDELNNSTSFKRKIMKKAKRIDKGVQSVDFSTKKCATSKWLFDCIEKHRLLDVSDYQPEVLSDEESNDEAEGSDHDDSEEKKGEDEEEN